MPTDRPDMEGRGTSARLEYRRRLLTFGANKAKETEPVEEWRPKLARYAQFVSELK